MPGMMAEAVRILSTTRKREITQTELLHLVAERTGRPVDTVRGTVIGYRSDKLMGKPEITKKWAYCRNPTRFVKKRYAKDVYAPSYDTPEKKKARTRAFAPLFRFSDAPRVLTLAAEEGYCVQQIIDVFPTADIVNIDRDIEVLQLPTANAWCTLEEFVQNDSLEFDFLNLDLMGYLLGKKYRLFQYINKKTTAKAIAVTLQSGERFRNYGHWVSWAKRQFRGRDQIRQAMETAFSNFTLTDCFSYVRDKTVQCRPMRVFVFERS